MLNLIKWLKHNYQLNCIILLQAGGEIEKDFEAVGKTFIWNAHYTLSNNTEKIASRIGYKKLSISYTNRVINEIKNANPELVISNTIASNKISFLLKQHLSCPFVAIYHEMKFSAKFYYADLIEKKFINIFDKIIVVNEYIKQFIIEDYFFNEKNIVTISPFINTDTVNNILQNQNSQTFNILLSGFGSWQKGFDLLGPLLSNITYKKLSNRFSFTWLGEIPEINYKMLMFELDQIGATHLINFPGKISNILDYFSRASLFLLLSKEDSFPLACLEAASYGLPIVAFEKSGGIVEFIKKGAGVCVPYMDLNEMINRIILFESDRNYYERTSASAKKLSLNYNIDLLAPKIVNVLFDAGLRLQKK